MNPDFFRRKIELLLTSADIRINGDRPWDIQVHDPRLYARVLVHGSLGLGESYMDGWWDCERLDEFFHKALRAELETRLPTLGLFWSSLKAKLLNLQTPSRSYRSGQFHYDIGNDLYENMLDSQMLYTAGHWDNASTLEEAQKRKLDHVCRRLHLEPGMRVLDIGCGWGGTARFLAERYRVEVLGISVAKEQVDFAKELCRGLPVEIRLQDYRSLDGKFDRVLSLGMFEHVGYKNYPQFMRLVRKCLTDDGLFLLSTIGGNSAVRTTDPWIGRYIFPNGMLPSPTQISTALEGVFVLEEWTNCGPDYDITLMHWFNNFDRNWNRLRQKYGERFYRMWKYYLLSCAGGFRARSNQLWELLLSPKGIPNGSCNRSAWSPMERTAPARA